LKKNSRLVAILTATEKTGACAQTNFAYNPTMLCSKDCQRCDSRSPFSKVNHMPKQKTHKGSKKRFRVTAQGKLKRKRAGKRHLNSHKTGEHLRRLGENVTMTGRLARKVVNAILGK
jgi:large subunit ribosomal protein L35